jgi:hypothetical protein
VPTTRDLMQQAFSFGDEILHQSDVDCSSAKFLVYAIFGLVEAVAVAVMIIQYLVQVL